MKLKEVLTERNKKRIIEHAKTLAYDIVREYPKIIVYDTSKLDVATNNIIQRVFREVSDLIDPYAKHNPGLIDDVISTISEHGPYSEHFANIRQPIDKAFNIFGMWRERAITGEEISKLQEDEEMHNAIKCLSEILVYTKRVNGKKRKFLSTELPEAFVEYLTENGWVMDITPEYVRIRNLNRKVVYSSAEQVNAIPFPYLEERPDAVFTILLKIKNVIVE